MAASVPSPLALFERRLFPLTTEFAETGVVGGDRIQIAIRRLPTGQDRLLYWRDILRG